MAAGRLARLRPLCHRVRRTARWLLKYDGAGELAAYVTLALLLLGLFAWDVALGGAARGLRERQGGAAAPASPSAGAAGAGAPSAFSVHSTDVASHRAAWQKYQEQEPERRLLAMVVAFHSAREMSAMRARLLHWEVQPDMAAPCDPDNLPPGFERPDLVFEYRGDLQSAPDAARLLMRDFEHSSYRRCFRQAVVVGCNLTEEQNEYKLQGGRVASKYNGPLLEFLCALEHATISSGYEFMFWVEPDVITVRRNWLYSIEEEALKAFAEDRWFVYPAYIGPRFKDNRDPSNPDHPIHFNGSPALYRVNPATGALSYVHRCYAAFGCRGKKLPGCIGQPGCIEGKCPFMWDMYLFTCFKRCKGVSPEKHKKELAAGIARLPPLGGPPVSTYCWPKYDASPLSVHIGSTWQVGHGRHSYERFSKWMPSNVTFVHSGYTVKEFDQLMKKLVARIDANPNAPAPAAAAADVVANEQQN